MNDGAEPHPHHPPAFLGQDIRRPPASGIGCQRLPPASSLENVSCSWEPPSLEMGGFWRGGGLLPPPRCSPQPMAVWCEAAPVPPVGTTVRCSSRSRAPSGIRQGRSPTEPAARLSPFPLPRDRGRKLCHCHTVPPCDMLLISRWSLGRLTLEKGRMGPLHLLKGRVSKNMGHTLNVILFKMFIEI